MIAKTKDLFQIGIYLIIVTGFMVTSSIDPSHLAHITAYDILSIGGEIFSRLILFSLLVFCFCGGVYLLLKNGLKKRRFKMLMSLDLTLVRRTKDKFVFIGLFILFLVLVAFLYIPSMNSTVRILSILVLFGFVIPILFHSFSRSFKLAVKLPIYVFWIIASVLCSCFVLKKIMNESSRLNSIEGCQSVSFTYQDKPYSFSNNNVVFAGTNYMKFESSDSTGRKVRVFERSKMTCYTEKYPLAESE